MDFQSFKPVALNAPIVSAKLDFADLMGAVKMRLGFGRDDYRVKPGLYRLGTPNGESDVLISANYKLSFDMLRKELDGLNLWILVVDTNGVNVWCAAGKGTFGTERVVKAIQEASLEHIVKHRKVILPQLCAPGVAAHLVKEQTGFRAVYGPALAKDIKTFVSAGYKATPELRKMNFPIKERAKLIPNDFMYGKYKILAIMAGLFFVAGLDRTGFLFQKMLSTGGFAVLNIFAAYVAGVVLGPLLLNWIPFRAFALKGAFWGVVTSLLLQSLFILSPLEFLGLGFMNVSIASFMTMNFTGSSTYTSLSGVQKEMKWAIPFQIGFAAMGVVLYLLSKLV
jgi:hypothetical protein